MQNEGHDVTILSCDPVESRKAFSSAHTARSHVGICAYHVAAAQWGNLAFCTLPPLSSFNLLPLHFNQPLFRLSRLVQNLDRQIQIAFCPTFSITLCLCIALCHHRFVEHPAKVIIGESYVSECCALVPKVKAALDLHLIAPGTISRLASISLFAILPTPQQRA
jgi:hypothetical protein